MDRLDALIVTGVEELQVWYQGSDTSRRLWLHADNLGSIIAESNASGMVERPYTYDPFGYPDRTGGSRFRYTGQIILDEGTLYYYKARVTRSRSAASCKPTRLATWTA